MSDIRNSTGCGNGKSKAQLLFNLQRFSGLIVVALLMTLGPARAEEPDDQYLRIYGLVQQADTLNTSGQTSQALAKYRQAHTELENFRKGNPGWNVKVVAYRLNYLAQQITALEDKLATPATPAKTNVTSEAEPAAKAPMASSMAQLKLLEAGAEPRKVLRLHPKPGDKQTVDMTMKMAIDMKIGEMQNPAMKLPAMKMILEVTTKNVSANGELSYEMLISDATVADEPGTAPPIAEAMKSSLANVKGLSGVGTMSDRGLNKMTEMKLPTGADPQLRQVMEQMKESFSQAGTPLPEEPIGPGAKWEVKRLLKSQGISIDQTTAYQLVSIEGERLTAKSTIIQSAANQKIQNPAMPGLKFDLVKMSGNGAGETTIDLAQLLPAKGTVDSHSELSMAMNTGAQKQTITMKMDLNLRLETK